MAQRLAIVIDDRGDIFDAVLYRVGPGSKADHAALDRLRNLADANGMTVKTTSAPGDDIVGLVEEYELKGSGEL